MSLIQSIRRRLGRRHIASYDTQFGKAQIYEETWQGIRIRVLDIEGTHQSGTFLDDRWCTPPFPYLNTFDHVFRAGLPVRDLCMLGGGGYAFPKHVIAHHPEARIDVVEVDPQITRIALRHFFLQRLMEEYHTQQTGRLAILTTDALSHLEECARTHRRYDAILDDCFVRGDHAPTLMTAQAASLAHLCLRPQGLYLANVISALTGEQAAPLMELVAVLSGEFCHVHALPCGRAKPTELDNVVVVASDAEPALKGSLRLFDALP